MATSKKSASPVAVKAETSVAQTKTKQSHSSRAQYQEKAPENDFFGLLTYVFKLYEPSFEALKLNLFTFILVGLVPAGLFALSLPFIFLALRGGAGLVISIFVLAILFVIACIFLPSIIITQLESAKGNKVSFTDVFEQCKPLVLPYIGLMILTALAVMVGLVFFILPGIVIALLLSFSTYFLADKKLGVIDSMKASGDLVIKKWQWVASLVILQIVLSVIVYIPLIGPIAAIVASVLYFCVGAIVYLKMTEE